MSLCAPGLLFIVNSLEMGGAEKQVVTLLNHLDARRFRLHLAYLKRGERLLPQLRTDKLAELLCCDVGRGLQPRAVRRLRRLIAARHIDAIVCTNTYSMLYGCLAQAWGSARPKLVTVFHTTLLRSRKEKAQMLLYRWLILLVVAIVAPGLPAGVTIRGGRSASLFGSKLSIGSQTDATIFGVTGDDVRITGLQPDVRPLIACCDVMTLVSHSIETFSLAALESMALAKPLVMTDIGGASEQVLHGRHGFLFAPGDIGALVRHLSSLTSPALRAQMGAAAARRVRQLFTVDAMTDGFTARLLGLLGGGESAGEYLT